jgi:hypothetical protein
VDRSPSGRDRVLREQERESDPSREGWTGRLRARWRVAVEEERARVERWLRLGALLDWAPAREILPCDEPADLTAAGRFGQEPALCAAKALAEAALESWGRGESGRIGREVLESFALPRDERRQRSDQAIQLGLSERPPSSQRTGEISPSGRAAALAGRALQVSMASDDEVEGAFGACLELSTGLLDPAQMLRLAREALIPLLQEELDRS